MSFRMPAEWEPHEGTWLAWPHERSDWPGKFPLVAWVYCDIIKRLARVERVHILVEDGDAESKIRTLLRKSAVELDGVDFIHYPTDRSWTRDYCPTFVKDGKNSTAILNWRFNGWAKYDNWKTDDAIPSKIAKKLRLPDVKPVLDGRRI